MVVPVIAIVVNFELGRKRDVPPATGNPAILAGGFALLAGLVAALILGTMPGSLIGLVGFLQLRGCCASLDSSRFYPKIHLLLATEAWTVGRVGPTYKFS